MSLLYPLMLVGASSLVIPVVIHLIARHRFPVQDFPSTWLLRSDERTNVFAPKLVDAGQLLLRLLVLALLVLAMARLFGSWVSSEPAPRNVVLVIDCSASMNMLASGPDGRRVPLVDLARKTARELLETVQPPGQCAVIAAGEEARLLCSLGPTTAPAVAALDTITGTDGSGHGLIRAIALGCELVRGRREICSQVVVLTDLRSSAFEVRNAYDLRRIELAQRAMGDALQLLLVDVSRGASDNIGIVRASLRGRPPRVGDDAHVVVRVANSTTKPAKASLRLTVGNERQPGSKSISLDPGTDAVVDVTTPVNRSLRSFAQAHLTTRDALPNDDIFRLPFEVADVQRVLIVHSGSPASSPSPASQPREAAPSGKAAPPEGDATLTGAAILRYVLNPGRELGRGYGTGITTTTIGAEALSAQPLSKYDLIVLYDVSSLPEPVLGDLESFVREGKSLLIVCSGGLNPIRFNRTIASGVGKRKPLSPAEIGNEQVFDPPIRIVLTANPHPVLAPFKDPLQGDLSVIRLARLREVRSTAEGASVVLRGSGGQPLGLEMPLGHGRVALLTFGFELDHGNLARSRIFPVLMWRMVDYLTGQLRTRVPDVLTALRPAVLDVSEPAFAFVEELELTRVDPLGPTALRLPIQKEKTVLLEGLPSGQYLLHKVAASSVPGQLFSYARCIAVNPDPCESDMKQTSEEELRPVLGSRVGVAKAEDIGRFVPRGGEAWRWIVLLLAIVYGLEGIIAWALSARREKRRSAGGAE